MHADAFLQAILEDPEEDVHRHVFADWLEDQGDEVSLARAELIRLQLQRARLHPAAAQARALLPREQQLLEQYGGTWAARVAARASRPVFVRGFIEEVSLS